MFSMFHLGRPDVLPVGDLGVRNGMKHLYNLKVLSPPHMPFCTPRSTTEVRPSSWFNASRGWSERTTAVTCLFLEGPGR